MNKRPLLTKELDSATFKNYYYLKEELMDFCKINNLPTSGSKMDLNERICYFLENGIAMKINTKRKKTKKITELTLDSLIEENIKCTQVHRRFFEKHIGKSFSFNVAFQKWLKENSGLTYFEACDAYHAIKLNSKSQKTIIDTQFEYNTYIRDFFEDNKGRSLKEAIKCWNFKKSKAGSNKYHEDDLLTLINKKS